MAANENDERRAQINDDAAAVAEGGAEAPIKERINCKDNFMNKTQLNL